VIERLAEISILLAWVAAGYLAWRAVLVVLRSRWARHAYVSVEPGEARGRRADRCRGTLVGLAIGDALNLPAESLPRWLVRLRYPSGPRMRGGLVRLARRAGDVSDDTQLTISVARSIDRAGRYDHDRFLDELGQWSYMRIGAGRATARAAIAARRGRARPVTSEGNGAAMRVAPLAIAIADPEPLAAAVTRNAGATHDSDAAVRGARFVACLIREALAADAGAFAERGALAGAVERAAASSGFEPGLEADLLRGADADLDRALARAATSGHVAASIPTAVLILARHRLEVAAAMNAVFRIGGDTDSIGAIAGAILGAQLGLSGLPADWARAVRHRDYLVWLADRLASPEAPAGGEGAVVEVAGDVAARPVDVIVNAWNRNVLPPWLLVPQGVSRAIRRAGGRAAIRAIGRRAPLPLGAAAETRAGDLPCQFVVHVAGIDLSWRASERSVRSSARNALALARWLGARSVAMPLVGAGTGGLTADRVAAILREEAGAVAADFDRIEIVRR
jgi:O-acetyl-ADP-ribose deacetylase